MMAIENGSAAPTTPDPGRALPRVRSLLALFLLLAILAPDLGAQEAESDTLPRFELDSLVVSVLRTRVRLGESAHPISVVAGEDLRQGKSGISLDEAVSGVPGVEIQNRYNYAMGERVYMRGFGSRAQFGVRGVAVVVDGIPATLPDGQTTLDHVDVGSLGRVEAIRSPASALYGNAAGGVLRFETRQPPRSSFRQDFLAVTGSDGLRRYQSTTGGTAGGTGYLLNLSRLDYGGFRTDPTGPGQWGKAERTLFNGQLNHDFGDSHLQVTLNGMDLLGENPGFLNKEDLQAGDFHAHGFNVIQGTREDIQQGQAGVAWTMPVSDFELEALGYGVVRTVDSRIPPNVIDLDRQAGGVRLTLRSHDAPASDAFRWTSGVELDFQGDDRVEWENDGGAKGALVLDQEETVRSAAGFFQGIYPVGEVIDVQAGLRYDHFRFEADDRFGGEEDASGSRNMDAVSPSVGIEADVTPDLDLFGNLSTSFQTPTTSELSNRPDLERGFNPELEPQRSVGIEGGVRGSLGGRAAYEVMVYRTWLDDEIVPFEIPEQPGRAFFRNSGSSLHKGFEAFLSGVLTPGLTGRLTYTYADARFEEFTVDGEDFSGNRIPGLAPHRLEATLRAAADPWYAELTGQYRDEVPVNDSNSAHAESYTLFDVRAGGESLRLGAFNVSPFAGVRNVFDEIYSASVVPNAFGGRYYEPGPGRTFYVGLSTGWSAR